MSKQPTLQAIEMRQAQDALRSRQIADLCAERNNTLEKIEQIEADLKHIGHSGIIREDLRAVITDLNRRMELTVLEKMRLEKENLQLKKKLKAKFAKRK